MKKIFNIGFALLLALAFTGCEKEAEKTADFAMVTSSDGLLKINFNSAYTANPGVHLKINDARVSNLITTRTPFPGGGYNTNGDSRPDYLFVKPGAVKLSVAIPARNTATDSIVLYTTSLTIDANKNYTAHITDTGANTKVVVVTDDISMPAIGTSRYTFVHLMPDVPAIDLYHGTTLVAGNVPYLSSIVFTRTISGSAPDWTIRAAGTAPTGAALATYNSTNTVLSQRGYTVFATGYKGSTDAVRKAYVSFLLNK